MFLIEVLVVATGITHPIDTRRCSCYVAVVHAQNGPLYTVCLCILKGFVRRVIPTGILGTAVDVCGARDAVERADALPVGRCSDDVALAMHRMLIGEPDPAGITESWVLHAHASIIRFRAHCTLYMYSRATTAELRFVDSFRDVLECLLWECCDAQTVVAALAGHDCSSAHALHDVFPDACMRIEMLMDRHSVANWRVRYNSIVSSIRTRKDPAPQPVAG